MARLDYTAQNDKNVSVTFGDMPANPALVFVNTVSGKETPSASTLLQNGGSGSGDVPIASGLFGAYCLLAQTRDTTPKFIAQTVVFYIHAPAAQRTLLKIAKPARKKPAKKAKKKKSRR